MDGGSSINILYASTLCKMGVPESKLHVSNLTFHGVVQGIKDKPLGQIYLVVVFGTPDNFGLENLIIEVAAFDIAHHAIFGRPTYAKFMARPCYVYLKLKMPRPKGIITITGDPKRAEECANKSANIAESHVATAELDQYKQTVDTTQFSLCKKSATKSTF